MTNEERLIAAYRKADARAQCFILAVAEGEAEDWPKPKPRPHLTLVPDCPPKMGPKRRRAKN